MKPQFGKSFWLKDPLAGPVQTLGVDSGSSLRVRAVRTFRDLESPRNADQEVLKRQIDHEADVRALVERDNTPWERIEKRRPQKRPTGKWKSRTLVSLSVMCILTLIAIFVSEGLTSAHALTESMAVSRAAAGRLHQERLAEAATENRRQSLLWAGYSIALDYGKARRWQDLRPTVYDAQRVEPLMKDYYDRNPFVAKSLRSVSAGTFVDLPDRRYGKHPELVLFQGTYEDFSSAQYFLVVDGGEPLIEWEAMVGYNPSSIRDYVSKRSEDPALMRVQVKPHGYYSGYFSDSSAWASFRLVHPDEVDQVLYGYAPRESGIASELEEIFLTSTRDQEAMTLSLAFDPLDTEGIIQVEIKGIHRRGWIW